MNACKIVSLALCVFVVCAMQMTAAEPLSPFTAAEEVAYNKSPGIAVLFAGRTVKFQLPQGWSVKEIPVAREVRLFVGPGELPNDPRQLQRGLWLVHSPASAPDALRRRLKEELRLRVSDVTGGRAKLIGSPRRISVGEYPGLQQDMELPALESHGWIRRASHIVVASPWGLLEIHGIAPVDAEDQVRSGLQLILRSLRLQQPQPPLRARSPEVSDAQPVLGSWKGLKGRLHFSEHGRVELCFDRVATIEVQNDHRSPLVDFGDKLHGRFTAEDDVIFITWDDGSQLNYRWKIRQGELHLLDSTRRSSVLKRLFASQVNHR